jgi:TIGR03009 family protein
VLTVAAFLVIPPIDPALAAHLAGWEKQARGVTAFRAEFTLTRVDAVFKKERRYAGSLLGLTSGSVVLRLENLADKADYESFISDGKVLYFYSGLGKTVTEFRLPPPGAGESDGFSARLARELCPTEWFAVRLLSGATAREAAKRFDVSLFKEDEHYVYLKLRPRLPKDRQAFTHTRVALCGPGVRPPHVPYTPAEVFVAKVNGDTEHWTFTEVKLNPPDVDEMVFRFVEVPGFTLKKVPPPPKKAPSPPGALRPDGQN